MPEEEEFYHHEAAQSDSEAASRAPIGREVNVAKALLQAYLEKWLQPDTYYRELLTAYAPASARFVLDNGQQVSVLGDFSWESNDPQQRAVQVTRFMETIREKYPAILLVDGGFTTRTAGLGDIQGGRIVGGLLTNYDVVSSMTINVDVMVATLDEGSTSNLAMLVASVLGPPLRRFGDGNHIESHDGARSYQLTLPMGISFGGLSHENISDDARDSKWTCSASIELSMEAITNLRLPIPAKDGATSFSDPGVTIGVAVVDGATTKPSLVGPESVSAGRPATFRVVDPSGRDVALDPTWELALVNAKLASFDPRTRTLYPRRLGTTEMRLLSRATSTQGADGQPRKEVLSTWTFAVVP